jgi:hypothetical protein
MRLNRKRPAVVAVPFPPSPEQRKFSRVRRLLNRSSNRQEKFISWHPDRYGFDRGTYAAVVVVTKEGKEEVHPARSYDEARHIYRAL